MFTRLIIIPVARFRYSGDGKRTCRALSKKLFAFLRAYADSTDIYEATCTNRRVREGEGLLEGNPGGREWRYVHCVSSWNKQDVSLPIYPGDAGHHFSFQKNIPMGIEMNGPPPRARLLPFRGCS